MFDNVKQLENEIKDFEQNILASKDLVNGIKNIGESVKHQSELFEEETSRLSAELQSVPLKMQKVNEELTRQLIEENRKNSDDSLKQFKQYNDELNKSTNEVKGYHETLTNKYTELLDETKKEMDSAIFSVGEGFREESDKMIRGISSSVEEMKRVESSLISRYEELIKQSESMRQAIHNDIAETEKSINSKMTLLLVLTAIGIIASAVSIFM